MWVYLYEIADWLIILFTFLVALGVVLSPTARKYLAGFYSNLIAGIFDAASPVIGALAPSVGALIHQMAVAIQTYGPNIADEVKPLVGAVAGQNFLDATATLSAAGESTPDNCISQAGLALAEAFGSGISATAVAAGFEALFPEKLNTLDGLAPILAEMAGFKEVAAAIREPLYDAAFGKSAEYHFRSLFKPELPSEQNAVRWHSQRLLTDAQLRTLFGYSGLKTEYEDAFVASAYRAIQPRALTTLYQDVPFPTAEVQSMLEFAGIRPQDIPVLLDGMEQASIKNVRNSYLAAIEQAWSRGDLTDAEALDDLQQLNFSPQAINFVQLTVANRKLVQLSELYRKSIDEAYAYGLITDADYVPQLEAIGIGAADAEAHYQVASFKKQGKALLAEERAAAAATRALIRSTSNAAIADFQAGTLDATQLAATLAAAGMAPLLIPSVIAYQTARQQGRLRMVFGKLKKPADAAILRSQVADVIERVYKKLVTPQQGLTVLEGLGLDQATAAPLIGNAAAKAGINWP